MATLLELTWHLPRLVVYYDGGCPVCTREIGFYQRRRGAERIRWINPAQCEDGELAANLSREAACARARPAS